MIWLLPKLQLNKEEETLYKQEKLYVTHFDFGTTFLLQNWPDRFILTVKFFGFGFRKVWIYESE